MFASCKKLVGVRLFGSRLCAVSLRNMHHKIRCARLTDIERIDACNRACMTENYHKDFYDQHILRWPELSLVAISEKDEQMMGYVLGRIEELPSDTPEYQETASGIRHEDQPPQHIGHLVSVSTFPMYRGHGIAQDLLKRLHFNFSEYYAMDAVNLFCRENTKKLFQSHFEYKPDGLMPGYYESGEDAHVMTLNGLMLRWSQLAPEEREKLRQQNKILQPMDSVRTIWVSSGVEKHGSKPTSVHEERSERPRVTLSTPRGGSGAGAGGAAAGRSQGPIAPPGSAGSSPTTATAGDWRSGQRIKLGGDHNDYP